MAGGCEDLVLIRSGSLAPAIACGSGLSLFRALSVWWVQEYRSSSVECAFQGKASERLELDMVAGQDDQGVSTDDGIR